MSAKRHEILVFRTNVRSDSDINLLRPILNTLTGPTRKWNFDPEDVDGILRVEGTGLSPFALIWHLEEAGFWCEELEDVIYPSRLPEMNGTQAKRESTVSASTSSD